MAAPSKKQRNEKKSSEKKPKASKFNFWQLNLPATIIIFLSGLGLYLSTVTFDYVLDDKIVITDNVYTNKGFAGIKGIMAEESFVGYFQKRMDLVAGSRYRPLSIVTFAIEREFFESPKSDEWGTPLKDAKGQPLMTGNPAISHFINALLYAFTGLLLFRILAMLFPGGEQKRPWYLCIPFAATMLFVVHPLHIEVVANIKGRDEIMVLMFSLLALYYSLRYVEEESVSKLVLSGFMLFLGLLSKENAITFVAIIPLSLYFFTKANRGQYIATTIPLVVVTLFYLMIRYQVIGFFFSGKEITDLMNNPFYGMTGMQRAATIVYTLGLYLKMCFYPHPLTHDYYPYAIPIMEMSDWRSILSFVAHLALVIVAILGFKKKSIFSYSILFYLIALSIVSNVLIPIGSFMNERFMYFSSIGFVIAVAYFFFEVLPELLNTKADAIRKAGAVTMTCFALALSIKSIDRIPALRSTATLNEADIETSANSCETNCFMGVNMYQQFLRAKTDSAKQALLARAESYLNRSMSIYPDYHAAHQMMSGVYTEQFKYHQDINRLLDGLGRMADSREKIDYIEQYFAYLNRFPQYKTVLVPFYHKLAIDVMVKKRKDLNRARNYVQMGLELDPTNPQLLQDRAELGGTNLKL